MSSNREKLKSLSDSAFENEHEHVKPFGAFNPLQQERILTHMNTIGSKKEEMHRFNEALSEGDIKGADSL